MLIAISRPVPDHLGSCGLEGGVDLLHSIAEVLTVPYSISQTKNGDRLVFQINACSIKAGQCFQRHIAPSSSIRHPIMHDLSDLDILGVCIPLMSSRIPSQLVPLRSVSQSVFQVGAPTTRPSKSGSFPSSVSPMSAGSAASPPSSYTKSQDVCTDHAPFCSEARLHDYLLDNASNVLCVPCASAEENTKLRQADVSPLLQSIRPTPGQRCATRA